MKALHEEEEANVRGKNDEVKVDAELRPSA